MKSMKHAATQELFSYWNRLRGERLAADRADIDPGAIRGVLADTFILDVSEPDCAPLRITGSRLNALFVNELKGHDFVGLWQTESRLAMQELLENTINEQVPALAGVRASPAGRPPLDFELLLLPLRHFGRAKARILGCLSPAAVPLWLGLVPVTSLTLGPMRIIRTPGPGEAPGFGTATAATLNLPLRHGHLRVHNGDISAQTNSFDKPR